MQHATLAAIRALQRSAKIPPELKHKAAYILLAEQEQRDAAGEIGGGTDGSSSSSQTPSRKRHESTTELPLAKDPKRALLDALMPPDERRVVLDELFSGDNPLDSDAFLGFAHPDSLFEDMATESKYIPGVMIRLRYSTWLDHVLSFTAYGPKAPVWIVAVERLEIFDAFARIQQDPFSKWQRRLSSMIPNLRELRLNDMDLDGCIFSPASFPKLETLAMINCKTPKDAVRVIGFTRSDRSKQATLLKTLVAVDTLRLSPFVVYLSQELRALRTLKWGADIRVVPLIYCTMQVLDTLIIGGQWQASANAKDGLTLGWLAKQHLPKYENRVARIGIEWERPALPNIGIFPSLQDVVVYARGAGLPVRRFAKTLAAALAFIDEKGSRATRSLRRLTMDRIELVDDKLPDGTVITDESRGLMTVMPAKQLAYAMAFLDASTLAVLYRFPNAMMLILDIRKLGANEETQVVLAMERAVAEQMGSARPLGGQQDWTGFASYSMLYPDYEVEANVDFPR